MHAILDQIFCSVFRLSNDRPGQQGKSREREDREEGKEKDSTANGLEHDDTTLE